MGLAFNSYLAFFVSTWVLY